MKNKKILNALASLPVNKDIETLKEQELSELLGGQSGDCINKWKVKCKGGYHSQTPDDDLNPDG